MVCELFRVLNGYSRRHVTIHMETHRLSNNRNKLYKIEYKVTVIIC